jgi:uncharacterized membrane protein YheB (UPF0754 family)
MIQNFLSIMRDRETPLDQRVFALLEVVLFPVSLATVIAMFRQPFLRHYGYVPPEWLDKVAMPILVAGAIGYLTNRLAIEMLFKPYRRTCRHILPWLTFGYWKQGLVPRNKEKIADVVGRQAEGRFIDPAKLADDVCAAVGAALSDPHVAEAVREAAKRQIDAHGGEIAEAVSGHVRRAVSRQIAERLGPIGGMVAPVADAVVASAITPDAVATTLGGLIDSPDASRALDAIRPELERLVREQCLPRIYGSLNIGGRITDAIDKMDVEEFHQVVNEVAARHLGAIQVLGYILGAIAGAIMVALK